MWGFLLLDLFFVGFFVCLVLVLLILLPLLWLGEKAQHDFITLAGLMVLWTVSKDGCMLHGGYCLFLKDPWNLVSL